MDHRELNIPTADLHQFGDNLQPAKGAIYWRGAASEAVAATTTQYFIESFSSRVLTSCATVDRFWPTAT